MTGFYIHSQITQEESPPDTAVIAIFMLFQACSPSEHILFYCIFQHHHWISLAPLFTSLMDSFYQLFHVYVFPHALYDLSKPF